MCARVCAFQVNGRGAVAKMAASEGSANTVSHLLLPSAEFLVGLLAYKEFFGICMQFRFSTNRTDRDLAHIRLSGLFVSKEALDHFQLTRKDEDIDPVVAWLRAVAPTDTKATRWSVTFEVHKKPTQMHTVLCLPADSKQNPSGSPRMLCDTKKDEKAVEGPAYTMKNVAHELHSALGKTRVYADYLRILEQIRMSKKRVKYGAMLCVPVPATIGSPTAAGGSQASSSARRPATLKAVAAEARVAQHQQMWLTDEAARRIVEKYNSKFSGARR